MPTAYSASHHGICVTVSRIAQILKTDMGRTKAQQHVMTQVNKGVGVMGVGLPHAWENGDILREMFAILTC